MPIVLNVIYLTLLAAFSPLLARRAWKAGKYREGWLEKLLGRSPTRVGDGPCLWFHAVSVGVVNLLRPLIADMRRRRPHWEVVVSTTTTTGLALARKTYPDLVTFYAPFDFSWATRRAIASIRPSALVLVELEVWPNLIRMAKVSGARVAIINGRLSARSHKGYRRLRGPLGPTFRRFDSVTVQTDEYADRFADIGVPRGVIRVTGSVKYDGVETDRANRKTQELRRALGLTSAELIFVAGSTMEREEEAALAAYRRARKSHPGLRLVVVPRHAERFDEVARRLESAGERVIRRSRGDAPAAPGEPPPVILLDTIGELGAAWGLADVAFVGGSLFAGRGGQNMIEPAAYGASVLFGPHTTNFRDTVEHLLSRGAARRVADPADLARALLNDLDDPEAAARRGESARAFVAWRTGRGLLADVHRDRPARRRLIISAPERRSHGGRRTVW